MLRRVRSKRLLRCAVALVTSLVLVTMTAGVAFGAKQSQTITFASLPDVTYGHAPITLTATASSGLTVTFTRTGQCSVSGSTLTITGAGSCTVTAHQAGNATFAAAPTVAWTFTISKAGQTITFGTLPDRAYGQLPFMLTASASSGLPVSYSASGPCSVIANILIITGAGICSVTASQGGNANYNAALAVTQSFTIDKAGQTILFLPLADRTYPHAPITLTAIATSLLSVSFSASGPCTVSGSTVTITGAGICSVTASQGGDADYSAAADVTRSFTIGKAGQTITFANPGGRTYGDAPFTLTASTTAPGLTVTFTATGQCSVSGSTLTLTGTGSCTVTAHQVGDANYSPAADVPQTFSIGQGSQTITFANPGPKTYGDAPFDLGATTTAAGLAVTYNVDSGPCTVSGSFLTITGIGTCTVTASQPGNGNYGAATDVTESFDVTARPVLTVTADDQSRDFGAANPNPLTYQITGYLPGDDASSVSTLPTCTTAADATSAVGTYDITCSGAASNKYAFSYVAGTLTVAQQVGGVTFTPVRSPTPPVTASSGSSPRGDSMPLFALLICFAFGGLGWLAVQAQRRTLRS